jgi:hypothetical protein
VWYKATSVIAAIEQCGQLSVAAHTHVPACPKKGNNIHCLTDFPDCEGKEQKCPQTLQLTNKDGDPVFLYFNYYLSRDDRDGRIKKKNTALLTLIDKYKIDENLMISVACAYFATCFIFLCPSSFATV